MVLSGTNWACCSFGVLGVMVWSVILLTVTSPNVLMDGNTSFDSSKDTVTRFNFDVVICNSMSAWCRYLSIFRHRRKACFSYPCSTINNISMRYDSTFSVAAKTMEISSCKNFAFSWPSISNLLVSSFSIWLILWMNFSLIFFTFSFILCLSSIISSTFSSLYFNILLYVWLILVNCSWQSENSWDCLAPFDAESRDVVLTHDLCALARQSRQHSSSWSTQKYSTWQSVCCSQTRLSFSKSDEYNVFSFKSTTWWFLVAFKAVWNSVHSEHNSSSHSIHQFTDVVILSRIWQWSQISAVAMVNSIKYRLLWLQFS